mgnify:CR=1 FL=1
MQAEWLDATGFALKASTLNRLLDSFSESPLATWGDSRDQASAAPLAPAASSSSATRRSTSCRCARARGATCASPSRRAGRTAGTRRSEEIVYLQADDDLHPSLVLADGAFWRVAGGHRPAIDAPARVVGQPAGSRAGASASWRCSRRASRCRRRARAAHARHRARPVVTLDLDAEDWIHVRAFAHTGGERWRPGDEDPATVVFELDVEGQWIRLETRRESSDDARARSRSVAARRRRAMSRAGSTRRCEPARRGRGGGGRTHDLGRGARSRVSSFPSANGSRGSR